MPSTCGCVRLCVCACLSVIAVSSPFLSFSPCELFLFVGYQKAVWILTTSLSLAIPLKGDGGGEIDSDLALCRITMEEILLLLLKEGLEYVFVSAFVGLIIFLFSRSSGVKFGGGHGDHPSWHFYGYVCVHRLAWA